MPSSQVKKLITDFSRGMEEEFGTLFPGMSQERPIAPFDAWLPVVTPHFRWDWPYLRRIQEQVHRVTTGEIDRLMLSVPPRHGKSELVTVRYPVWRMERDPATRVVVAAYNATLACKFSRKARRIAEERLVLSKDRTAVDDWETEAGGGLRAVGVGGGITGQGGHVIVIDDPVKSRAEAESPAYREAVWNWYKDDLWTRLEPGGAIILIMTRWHEDDLAGRLLREMDEGEGDDWAICNLPALAEENDPLGRAPGEALCPDRYDEAALDRAKKVLGTYSFSALYQQRPSAREGSFFKRAWFPIVDVAPVQARRVRYWDKGATEDSGDFSVGLLMAATDDGLFYVEDVVRGQWAPGNRNKVMIQTAQMDAAKYGGGVQIWTEQEGGSGGKESALSTVRLLSGFSVRYEVATGDKMVRADPFAAQAEAGNVRVVAGAWNGAYVEELCAFPSGKNDDQVDTSSGAFKQLSGGPWWQDTSTLDYLAGRHQG